MHLKSTLIAAGLALISSFSASARVGGGITGGGLAGEYFANADLTGSPSFTRRELRLDFDWGTVLPIGGSNDPRYKNFPVDNFSARYTGKIIAAFTETYTFKVVADDGARLFIRPEGGTTWTTLIDQWSAAGTYTATSALVKGTRYEIKVEYRELTGTAALRLLWSSPSTPEEVIDPVMNQGFNITYWGQVYADLAKSGRSTWETNGNGAVAQDANGWPQNDAALYIQETLNVGLDTDPLTAGKVTFSFKGRATVRFQGNVDATGMVVTYNATTNTSSGTFEVKNNGWNATNIQFTDTDRDGQLPARKNGITDLKLMRAATPGGTTPYPDGTIFIDQARDATSKFTSLRVNLNNANSERFWSDRTIGTFFNQSSGKQTNNYYSWAGGVDPNPGPTPNGPSWEYSIMLANETGADLYINIPVMADGWSPSDTNGYVNKLAQLIRYGSDGVNPYTGPTANPVFPPLNPNLRVYVELSNELWNGMSAAFRQYFDVGEMLKMDVRLALGTPTADDLVDPLARPSDFAIYNYDNLPTTQDANGNYNSSNTWRLRKNILRAVQISNIFRGVWGDANMGPRVRPLYEWQYENANSTASTPLKFVNDYFNNGDGNTHVATPRPVNYYIWGGGGASYYGATNGYGTTDQLINPSFETPVVPNGYNAAPSGATWTFTGNAGIARDAGSGDDIPPGWSGSAQCGYIAGTGSMWIQVTIPSSQTSNTYAFVFKAVNRTKVGAPTPDTQNLQVYVNGVLKNWKSFNQSGGYTPIAYDAGNPWNSFVVFWTPQTPYYSSSTFTAAPGETVTLRIEGTAAADQIAFLEDVRLASVDKIFADGMPGGGEAAGQPAGFGYQTGLNIQASWALAYGLNYVTYEGGWSLGGDTGGTPLQNMGKFTSPDAAVANIKALTMFSQAGGYMNVFGTYTLWPNWAEAMAVEGLFDVSQYPLISSQATAMNSLPADPSNGVFLPNSLVIGNASLRSGGTGDITDRNWVSWNAISTTTDTYTVAIKTGTGGVAQLWVDGVALGDSFTTGGTTTRTINLTKGIHGIRLQGISGTFSLQSIALAIPGAPAATSITSITDGSGSKIITWAPVSGATGYTVRWGVDKGVYLQSADVPSGTTKTLTGLSHDQTYYFVVVAYNAIGLSLPSPEVGSTALVDGLSGHLARWEFTGNTGNEATVPPTASTSRLTLTPLARGPGLQLSGYGLTYTADSFAYQQVGTLSTTAAGALTAGHYSEFTVTPVAGTAVSISSLAYAPYWQNSAPALADIGIAYSINGGAYTIATVTGTPSFYGGSPLTATLSGVAALQNLTVPVTFRLLQPNLGQYSFAGIGRYTAGDDIVLFGSVDIPGTTVAAPVISPAGGSFSGSQSVTLSTTTPGATIRYTTDGSTPTSTTGTVYSGAFTVSATTTVRAIAYAATLDDSSVSSATFTLVLPTVAAPTFTPTAGTYASPQSVTLATATAGATIRYTTDGSTPTSTTGTVYTGPFTISATTIVKAIAYASGMTDSSVSPATFTITVASLSITARGDNAASGEGIDKLTDGNLTTKWLDFSATSWVRFDYASPTIWTAYTITSANDAPERDPKNWTISGSNDGTTWTVIDTRTNQTWAARAQINTYALTNTTAYTYYKWDITANGSGTLIQAAEFIPSILVAPTVVANPTITPAVGTYTTTQSVTLSTTTSGASIRYTTDGSTPTSTTGTLYSTPVSVSTSQTLKAIAYKSGQADSSVVSAAYIINLPTYAVSYNANGSTNGSAPAGQTKIPGVALTLATNSGNLAKTGYTFAGWNTAADGSGTDYAVSTSYTTDAVLSLFAKWTALTTAVPTFTPAAGTYTATQNVAISTTTAGASIRYTTDGSTPTSTTGTLYSGAISVSTSQTLKAIAYLSGHADSSVSSAGYVINLVTSGVVSYPGMDASFATEGAAQSTAVIPLDPAHTFSSASGEVRYYSGTIDLNYLHSNPWTTDGATYVNFLWNANAVDPDLVAATIGVGFSDQTPKFSFPDFGYTTGTAMPGTIDYQIKLTGTGGAYTIAIFTGPAAKAATEGTPTSTGSGNFTYYGDYITAVSFSTSGGDNVGTAASSNFKSSATWISGIPVLPTVDAPDFTPPAGTYTSAQSVTLSTTTSGSTIRYTTDGSTPTSTTGTVYTAPVAVGASQTLKAIAYQSGMTDSPVASAAYIINLPTYAVSYDANGSDSGNAPAAQTKIQGIALTLASNSGTLAKTGYAFAGWNTAADGSGSDYALSASYTTDAALTLYAKWTALPTYAVSYDANGSDSGSIPAAQTKTQGIALTLASNSGTLAKTDYIFAGWNTAADGSGTTYALSASYTADAALALYAKWTVPATYAVSYNANGATSGTVPASQMKTQSVALTLANNSGTLAKTGYILAGWNTAADGSGTNYAASAGYTTDAPLTLYARWTSSLLEWTVFTGNSGGNANPTETATIIATDLQASSGVLLRGAKFNPTGDQSYGPWPSNFFGTQEFLNPTNLAGSISANIYAAFTITPVPGYAPSVSGVNFYAYGLQGPTTAELLYSTDGFATYTSLGSQASGAPLAFATSTLLTYNTSAVDALQNATTPLAFRIYFYGEDNGYWVRGIGGDPSSSTPVLKVTGTLAATTYAVSYNANSATSGSVPAPQSKTYGIPLSLANNSGSLARTGYTFAGWNTAANGSGTTYALSASYTIDAALTLYATWAIIPAPSAPSGLNASADSASRITLNWTDNASDEAGFKIERSSDGSTDWTQIATPAANAISYADTGLVHATTYYYRVCATNAVGDSTWSDIASDTTFRLNQTITFEALDSKQAGDAAFNLTATSSSGLSVGYGSSNPSVAIVSGSTVNIVGVGSTTITAIQPGNTYYFAAPSVEQVLTVTAVATDLTATTAALSGANVGTGSSGAATVLTDSDWWIDGSGSGLAGTADSFHFENRSVIGDVQILVCVRSVTSTGSTPRAGLMLRESNTAGARHVMVAIPSGSTGSYLYGSRTTTNAAANETTAIGTGSTFVAPDTWMILQRKGDTVTIATSTASDGPFNTLGAVTLANLGATLQAGVFSSSGSVGVNARAVMSGFEMINLDVDNGISSRWKLESNLSATPTTYNGTAVGSISYATGKLGSYALSLNGTNTNYVNTPYVLNPQAGSFTATAWVKLASAVSGRSYFILHQNTLSGTGRGWLYRNGSGKVACILGNVELASASTLPADGNWYHVAVVKNGNTGNNIQLYINGVANGSPGARTVESCLGAMRIGAHRSPSTSNRNWNGQIDDVRIYNRALLPSEIQTIANWAE